MGVKGLWRLLLPIGRRISIETLEGKILAIDASIWLTQFIKAMRDPETGKVQAAAHLIGFFRRICRLLFHGIKPVFVFDGATPEIKKRELALRRRRRETFITLGEDVAIQRLARRLLAETLRKQMNIKNTASITKKLNSTEMADISPPPHPPTAKEKKNGAISNSAFAAGFNPGNTHRGHEDSRAEHVVEIKEATVENNQHANYETNGAIIERQCEHDETDDEAVVCKTTTNKFHEFEEASQDKVNDWDNPQSEESSRCDESDDGSKIEYEDFGVERNDRENVRKDCTFDLNELASLPPSKRKEAIEDAKRQQRLQSRREFMPAAANPLQFSQVQIANFLRSTQLNKSIEKMAIESARRDNHGGKGEILASDRGTRVELIRENEGTSRQSSNSNHEVPSRFPRLKRALLRENKQRTQDSSSEDELWIEGSASKTCDGWSEDHGNLSEAHRPRTRAIQSDSDDNDESPGDEGGFLSIAPTSIGKENNIFENVPGEGFLQSGGVKDEQKSMDLAKIPTMQTSCTASEEVTEFVNHPKVGFSLSSYLSEHSLDLVPCDVMNPVYDLTSKSQNICTDRVSSEIDSNLSLAPHSNCLSDPRIIQELNDRAIAEALQSEEESGIDVNHHGISSEPCETYETRCRDDSTAVQATSFPTAGTAHLLTLHNRSDVKCSELGCGQSEEIGSDEDDIEWEDGVVLDEDTCNDQADGSTRNDQRTHKWRKEVAELSEAGDSRNPEGMQLVHRRIDGKVDFACFLPESKSETVDTSVGKALSRYVPQRPDYDVGRSYYSTVLEEHPEEIITDYSNEQVSDYISKRSTQGSAVDETAAALERAQETASRLANWAGNVFRRVMREVGKSNESANFCLQDPDKLNDQHIGCVDVSPSKFEQNKSTVMRSTDKNEITGNEDVSDHKYPTDKLGTKGCDVQSTVIPFIEMSDLGTPAKHYLVPDAAGGSFVEDCADDSSGQQSPDKEGRYRRKAMNEPFDPLSYDGHGLLEESNKFERDADTITDEMRLEAIQLLQLFGIPYVEAPAEAEAQCAALEELGLVDGVVTEDSDVFIFGAKTVYKNIFDEMKYVEVYLAADAEREMALGRNHLIAMAMLLGGDYTEGVKGVGIVNAMEILEAFDVSSDLRQGLSSFKKWLDGLDYVDDTQLKPENVNSAELSFHVKHRSARLRWVAPALFPNERVIAAYTTPVVDKSKTRFTWGTPDIESLLCFCGRSMGWSNEETLKCLNPVVSRSRAGSRQTRIDSFMTYDNNITFADVRSKRLRAVLKGVQAKSNTNARSKKARKD